MLCAEFSSCTGFHPDLRSQCVFQKKANDEVNQQANRAERGLRRETTVTTPLGSRLSEGLFIVESALSLYS